MYPNEIHAIGALEEVKERRARAGQATCEQAVYRCRFCDTWHLTRQVQR